jgi:hypothetical protein
MFSKSSTNSSNKTRGDLGLQICNNQSMVNTTLTHITINLKTTILSHRKIRKTRRRRRIMGSGANSRKSLGKTLINVARNNH